MPGDSEEAKKAILVQRRSMILAIVQGTPPESPSMTRLLEDGFLSVVKGWLDDVLSGSVGEYCCRSVGASTVECDCISGSPSNVAPSFSSPGGVDFLLHLLSSIVDLPVTKSVVKDSGMGKAVGALPKHKICAGTANETAIRDRVEKVKDAWNASVKAHKSQSAPSTKPPTTAPPPTTETSTGSSSSTSPTIIPAKRAADKSNSSPGSAKRIKMDVPSTKKTSSFSSLLQKVSADAPKRKLPSETGSQESDGNKSNSPPKKKSNKRVKWADHFGGALSVAQEIEGVEVSETEPKEVSWSDRKKRDRMREKELLAKAR